jgi:2-octaprenyl-6-methoxyphenol hydroxylase
LKADYDVVIAGGGMVGISLALALGHALGDSISILVVESIPLPSSPSSGVYQPSFDARATALGVGSRNVYEAIGIWEQLGPGLCPIETIHVSTRGRPGSTLLDAAAETLPALGYVVENQWLGRVLLAQLSRFPNVHWCAPATVKRMLIDHEGRRQVVLQRGGAASHPVGTEHPVGTQHPVGTEQRVACDLLVVADGANSALARSLGVNYIETDYGHSAVIANVATSKPHAGRAFERFTDQGPIALLPLRSVHGQSRSGLVWTLPTAMAQIVMQLREEAFISHLQERFGFRLGVFDKVGQCHSYPLKLVEAMEQVRSGVVLMGNAAHSLHPVAGQGFNLALRDVAHLAEVLVSAHQQGRRCGDLSVLQLYQQGQNWDQRKTTLFSDRVSELFALNQPLVAVARDVGLTALDVVTPVKSWFVRQATGLGGNSAHW